MMVVQHSWGLLWVEHALLDQQYTALLLLSLYPTRRIRIMGSLNRSIVGLFFAVLWVDLRYSLAFLAPSATTARHGSIVSALAAQIPVISEWEVKKNGSITGVVRNHPTIPNGDVITTSPLAADVSKLQDNQLVSTKSGSQYRLGKSANGVAAPTSAAQSAAATKNLVAQPTSAGTKPAPRVTEPSATKKEQYNLNGKSIGNGRYLLVGQKLKSTSMRSEIYYAYRASNDGSPTGPRVTVKVSTNLEGLERENEIYNKVNGGLFYRDNFVRKIDYLPDAQGNRGFGKNCGALVLESGERTLRALCDARRNQGLSGKAMRQAAVALVQCIQAMQSYGLVWTDLKAENFVVVSDTLGDGSIEGIKAIDLESAVRAGGPPMDYSPEACPPEFAQAVARGEGPNFIVREEYDSWSYGMLLYELAVGKSYWKGKQDDAITRILKEPGFQVDVSAIEDDKLRDMVSKCLQTDPKKRLKITQILFHPYFLTTGIGPVSF
jgi:serine/threonine protein kinase